MSDFPFRDSSLPMKERVSDLLARLTPEEKMNMLSCHMAAVPRLGVGEWYVGTEVARGYVGRDTGEISTVFPQPIGMASSFDPELMYELGVIAGNEARYHYQNSPNGKLMLWGPTVDMERDPRWGRTEEAYGEDPFLTGEMSKAFTKGMAGDDPVYLKTIPALKHFCADNNEADRDRCSANVDMRTLHEYYYRAFKPAITEGGARSVMAAYNELSGVPAVMNPDLQKLLKDVWGLDFVVTDGGDFSQNVLAHKCVQTHAEALALCLKNGADSMNDPADMVAAAAADALEKGLITMSDIDKAVGNVLYGRFRLGEFDENYPYRDMKVVPESEESRAVNRRAAMEQFCLLKNDGLLPLEKGTKIALTGPIADENYADWYTGKSSYAVSIRQGLEAEFGAENVLFDNGYDIVAVKSCGNGKYLSVGGDGSVRAAADGITESCLFELHDWDFGSMNFKSKLNGKYLTESGGVYKAVSDTPYEWFIREWFKPTVYEGKYCFKSWHGKAMDIFVNGDGELSTRAALGITPDKQFELTVVSSGAERAAELARKADIAVVCAGNHPMQVARECYDRPDIVLPKRQSGLIEAVFEANPKTALMITAGYPYAVKREKEKLPAMLFTSHAGPELGTAAAAVLAGKFNPAARCPLTWYESVHELPNIKDYDIIGNNMTYMYYGGKPLFPFGHGLSYSEFEYGSFKAVQNGKSVKVSLTVKNVSERDGDEVVQIYFKAGKPRVKRPLKQLCGFKRTRVGAGETVAVEIDVPFSALEFYDVTREKLCVESGSYTFSAGASSEDIRCSAELNIEGEIIPPRDMSFVKAKNNDGGYNISLCFSFERNDHYVMSGDWGGGLVFSSAEMKNYTVAEVVCSAPAKGGSLEINADERLIGRTDVSPSPRPDGFAAYRIPLEPLSGTANLRIALNGQLGVYSVKFM
ncbi:MAG: glycoside hydrolase family 3 C-terminal domain-containing protein [Prevotella sp.]|nr:glycoside hydrolase family 3 C-terminal domain-containing protein [Prevotella sp.]